MAREDGVVARFDKGFGFITPDAGGKDVFVHFSDLQMEGFRVLEKGDRVEFELVQDAKGPRATYVTKIED
jgi:CspA family cold shock protein